MNDDYASFVNALVVPLARAGSTTCILDNRGHSDGQHARGASAKADLNEVVFELSVGKPFDRDTRGELIWSRRRQRFSGIPISMKQEIGGGVYELPVVTEEEGETKSDRRRSHQTYLMEKASRVIEAEPGKGSNFIEERIEGKRSQIFEAIQALVERGYVRKEEGARKSQLHFSITPFRRAKEESKGDSDDWFPTGSPTGSHDPGAFRERLVPPTGSPLKRGDRREPVSEALVPGLVPTTLLGQRTRRCPAMAEANG